MSAWIPALALTAALAGTATPVQAAPDFLPGIDGIKGESNDQASTRSVADRRWTGAALDGGFSLGPETRIDVLVAGTATASGSTLLHLHAVRGPAVEGQWDGATGKFGGDPAVLDALTELQATRLPEGTVLIAGAVPEPGTWALGLLGPGAIAARLRRAAA